jgi:hypothetical protein
MSIVKVFGLACLAVVATILLVATLPTIKNGPAMEAARRADEAKAAQVVQAANEMQDRHDKAMAACMGGGDTLSLPPKVFREMYERCEQILPVQAIATATPEEGASPAGEPPLEDNTQTAR